MSERGLRGRWAWSWQFDRDGSKEQQRAILTGADAGIIFKGLNGTNFQSTWDTSPDAISSATKAADIARWFQESGVPAAIWSVPRGFPAIIDQEIALTLDIIGRAWEYLDAFVLDVEPYAQFWQGSEADARRFVRAIRGRGVPIVAAPDARPWHLHGAMLAFCQEADGITPQAYWRTFAGAPNPAMYAAAGYPNNGTITPQFIAQATANVFRPLAAEKYIIGQGDAPAGDWEAFLQICRREFVGVSTWRTGVTPQPVFDVLGGTKWLDIEEVDDVADEALRAVVRELKGTVQEQGKEIDALQNQMRGTKAVVEKQGERIDAFEATAAFAADLAAHADNPLAHE